MFESEKGSKHKKPKSSSNQLELHVAIIYNELVTLLEDSDTSISLPQEVGTAIERVNLMKKAIEYFVENGGG